VYWRVRGRDRVKRAYADLRAFGGGKEALCEPGARHATSDPSRAQELLAARLRVLSGQASRRVRATAAASLELLPQDLESCVALHLENRARKRMIASATIAQHRRCLKRAIAFFTPTCKLDSITVKNVSDFVDWLRAQRSRLGKPFSNSQLKQHLDALSNLYTYAPTHWEGLLPLGYNPVMALQDKPKTARPGEAAFLEPDEVALLLEAARLYEPITLRPEREPRHVYEIVATYAYTGARKEEVLGLLAGDIRLTSSQVVIENNQFRTLKNENARRTIPLWPDLRRILEPLVRSTPPHQLLFPCHQTGRMLVTIDATLDRLAHLAGLTQKVRSHILRHTYCATRLQTMDHGERIAPVIVSRELGHGGTRLTDRVYTHVQTRRGRFKEVRYRLQDWPTRHAAAAAIPARLEAALKERDRELSKSRAAMGALSGARRQDYARRRRHARRQTAEEGVSAGDLRPSSLR
jgi:site-specific recombinase XerD